MIIVTCPNCGGNMTISANTRLSCSKCGLWSTNGEPPPIDSSIYDADYFLRGKEKGLSLYENYSWLPDLTIPMCQAIINHLPIRTGETVLDFGCARGYVVKALRKLGVKAVGVDVSTWAIKNCDESVENYCLLVEELKGVENGYDWIIAKDVLEHIPQTADTIDDLMKTARIGLFAVVPLSPARGERYVVPDYELDVTHVHRMTLLDWAFLFARPGWRVELAYRVPGVKDNYDKPGWEKGNGFLTARRIR